MAGYSIGMGRTSEPAPVPLRVGQAAEMLGVSVETLRRWESDGRLRTERSEGGQRLVSLEEVTRLLRARRRESVDRPIVAQSARNRFSGIVSRIDRDTIVAVVEVIAGPHRLVSLMTAEAVDDMGIEVGSEVVCAVKATNVVVEVPAGATSRAAEETAPGPGGTRALGR
jgi:molybdopterin-binding protein